MYRRGIAEKYYTCLLYTSETNRMGEILTDKNVRTSVKGIYAAGDVTDVSYKQIVIAMGEEMCIRDRDMPIWL